MNASKSGTRPSRKRMWSLLGIFAALIGIASGLLWWLSRPVNSSSGRQAGDP